MDARSPRLNHDILDYIAAYSTRGTILTLMRTCKALHRDGAKYLLEDLGQIDINIEQTEEDMLSFLLFMAAEQGHRWHFVRALRFVGGDILPPAVAGRLAGTLRQATKLKSLVLYHAEDFLKLHSDIAPALASLKTVEALEATFVWRNTFALIKTASWPLRTVNMSFQDRCNDRIPEEVNPAALFSAASSSVHPHRNYLRALENLRSVAPLLSRVPKRSATYHIG